MLQIPNPFICQRFPISNGSSGKGRPICIIKMFIEGLRFFRGSPFLQKIDDDMRQHWRYNVSISRVWQSILHSLLFLGREFQNSLSQPVLKLVFLKHLLDVVMIVIEYAAYLGIWQGAINPEVL